MKLTLLFIRSPYFCVSYLYLRGLQYFSLEVCSRCIYTILFRFCCSNQSVSITAKTFQQNDILCALCFKFSIQSMSILNFYCVVLRIQQTQNPFLKFFSTIKQIQASECAACLEITFSLVNTPNGNVTVNKSENTISIICLMRKM